jgi:hypothetical protein
MLIHYMVVEKCVFCVLTLGVGDLLKSGSISAREIVWGHYFHEQQGPVFAFADRKVSHHFFLRFSLSLYRFGWERGTLLAVCACVVTFVQHLTRRTSLL